MPRQDGTTRVARFKDLTLDERLQVRVSGVDEDYVEGLAEVAASRKGKKLPRLRVCVVENPPGYKAGTYTFLVDGWNRLEAYKRAGRKSAPALVKRCSWEKAVEIAATANLGDRALPLKKRDRAKAIEMILTVHGDGSDEPWSDGKIAQVLGLSGETVRLHRPKVEKPVKRMSQDGRLVSVPTPVEPDPEPDDGARELPADDLDVADFVRAAFRRSGVKTLGNLADHIATGGTMGLTAGIIEDLKETLRQSAVRAIPAKANGTKITPEAKKAGDPVYNWRAFDEAYGVVARAPDYLAGHYPELKDELKGLTRLLREFRSAWEEMRKKATTPEEK